MKPSNWSRGRIAALLVAAGVALSGCGILGCGGA
ncbi:putative lipoprotein, partial [Burkholderia cenocepacia BC7]